MRHRSSRAIRYTPGKSMASRGRWPSSAWRLGIPIEGSIDAANRFQGPREPIPTRSSAQRTRAWFFAPPFRKRSGSA